MDSSVTVTSSTLTNRQLVLIRVRPIFNSDFVNGRVGFEDKVDDLLGISGTFCVGSLKY